jgi:hypothetical protein
VVCSNPNLLERFAGGGGYDKQFAVTIVSIDIFVPSKRVCHDVVVVAALSRIAASSIQMKGMM